jgi:hypothetical protein
MFRAVEMYRWGGCVWLVGGLGESVLGLTRGDPHADSFTAGLAVFGLGGLAFVAWWLLRGLARVTAANVVEASTGRRAGRVVLICGASALLFLSGAFDPTHNTRLLGLCFAVSGVIQLSFAARVARLERRHGAHVLQDDSRGFFFFAH